MPDASHIATQRAAQPWDRLPPLREGLGLTLVVCCAVSLRRLRLIQTSRPSAFLSAIAGMNAKASHAYFVRHDNLRAAILALASAADAQSARKSKTGTEYTQQQRDRQACEERAKHEDRSGSYAGMLCWAREAFGRLLDRVRATSPRSGARLSENGRARCSLIWVPACSVCLSCLLTSLGLLRPR